MRPKSQALFFSFSYSSLSFSSLLSILPPLFPVSHPPSLPPLIPMVLCSSSSPGLDLYSFECHRNGWQNVHISDMTRLLLENSCFLFGSRATCGNEGRGADSVLFLLQPANRGQSSSLVPRCCSRPADRRMCLHASVGVWWITSSQKCNPFFNQRLCHPQILIY